MTGKCALCLAVLAASAAAALPPQEPQTALEVLERVDRNMVYESARAEMEMVIRVGGREIRKELVSFAQGNEKAFIEFLSPARDRGTKILKLRDIVRVYYPSAERVMRLSGHMLRQSMMGSDFSFEDMTERATRLREEYDAELLPGEESGGRPCFVLLLSARDQKKTYRSRKIWVDRERHIGLREELFAASGKLLKVMQVEEVSSLGRRFYPTRIRLRDALRENSQTEMRVKKIEFDLELPGDLFTEASLLRR